MTRLALAAATALGMAAAFTPVASAETYFECWDRIFDRVADDCALLAPRGSANWASCVETFIQIECQGLPGSSTDAKRLWASLNETH